MLVSRCSSTFKLWKSIFPLIHKATIHTGRATPEGTKTLCGTLISQNSNIAQVTLPRANWSVGRIGFSGCKLVPSNPEKSEHQSSVSAALMSFSNFVAAPASGEGVLGSALAPLLIGKDVLREQIVVAIRMGILRGQQLRALTTTFPQASIYNQKLEHHKYMYCISPEFLKHKIEDTLKTLDLDCLDLVLLEDPVFNYLQENEGKIDEMYDRITKAFQHLETEVAAGRIQYYGIASDAFTLPSSSPHHLSLSKLIEIAKTNNFQHFAAIEYPHNLAESGAVILKNNERNTITVSELAKRSNIMQIGNRPLTMKHEGRQFRLKSLDAHEDRDIDGLMNESFIFCSQLEKTSPVAVQDEININFEYPDILDVVWTQHIAANSLEGAHYLYKYLNWVELEANPRLEKVLKQLAKHERFILWTVRYRKAMESLFMRYQWALERVANNAAQRMENKLGQLSETLTPLDLTHQALCIALSGGPDLILCGMRLHRNLIHTSQLDQNQLLPKDFHNSIHVNFFTNFLKTDEAYSWLEKGDAADKESDVESISFGPVEEGTISHAIQRKQAANPIKHDSPIY